MFCIGHSSRIPNNSGLWSNALQHCTSWFVHFYEWREVSWFQLTRPHCKCLFSWEHRTHQFANNDSSICWRVTVSWLCCLGRHVPGGYKKCAFVYVCMHWRARWWFLIFYVLFHPYFGKWSNLTNIFFRWLETTNQRAFVYIWLLSGVWFDQTYTCCLFWTTNFLNGKGEAAKLASMRGLRKVDEGDV